MDGIQRQFMEFLDGIDAYDDFAYNLWKERKLGFKEFLENEEPRHWIGGSFVYPKGEIRHWRLIEKKWAEELEDIINTKYYKG